MSKARRNLEFAMRSLKGASVEAKRKAYVAVIRPLLEYACSVWDPYREGSKKELEAVQRRAARRVTGVWNAQDEEGVWNSATALVNSIGVESLEYRRKVERLSVVYRAYEGAKGWEEIQRKLIKNTSVCRSKHGKKLWSKGTNTDVGKFSCVNRTVVEWNQLEEAMVEAKNVKEFRRLLMHAYVREET